MRNMSSDADGENIQLLTSKFLQSLGSFCTDVQIPSRGSLAFWYLVYLGGRVDLVSRLIMGINWVIIWVIGVINLLTKSH